MTLNELLKQAILLQQQGFGEADVKVLASKDDVCITKTPIKSLKTYGKYTVLIEEK